TILVWTGSATHLLIKYRPYLSEPFLQYKAFVSIMGITVLSCALYARAHRSLTSGRRKLLTSCALALLISSALLRPSALSAMSQRGGMGTLPDPISSFASWSTERIRDARKVVSELQRRGGLAQPPPRR